MLLNNINPFSLSKRINRPLILDGAMGSLLQQMGVEVDGNMWMSLINLEKPELVLDAHRQYITAGADIITTNTFRTNPIAVEKYGKRINIKLLVRNSVGLAIEAAKGLPVFIAGSNSPAEDSYQPERKVTAKELKANHSKHIDLLMESGCNFILNETQNHFDEIKIICGHCSKNNIPYILSIFFDENFRLYSGEKADYVLKYIADYSPLAIGINCIKPDTFLKYFNKLKLNYNWGFYLNCGKGEFSDTNIKQGVTPNAYLNTI
ncbi:MAG: homocysteine S-methyltransferase family protein, partial [Ignavibacteriaceae bacterium]|nr:homocysteine S-methyltransferase family protein [Ignavibacteriaceae bacterium]